jgi:hypothetical protein
MALIEEALYSYLSGYAGLIALTSTRIYPDICPQEPTVPYVVFYKTTDTPEYAMGGETVLTDTVMQFDCISTGSLQARQVAEQLRLALSGFSGAMGTGASEVTVDWAELLSQHDQYTDNAGRFTGYVTRISEYFISYRQTAATP